jgi:hypothetical protein
LTSIVAYQVTDDGNWDPVPFKKGFLKPEEVFILVNEEKKEIWLWIGQKAEVRTRFISSTVAQEIRRLYGLTLRVRAADQGEEPDEFWECINSIPKEGLGPSMIKSDLIKASYSKSLSSNKIMEESKKNEVEKSVKESKKQKMSTMRKRTVKKISKNIVNSRTDSMKTLNSYFKADTSLVTIPPCPKCKDGYLLPYSKAINVTTRRKDVLPIAKWICSNCQFSPTDVDSE